MMSKKTLIDEHIITTIIVLILVAVNYIHKEWKDFSSNGIKWGVLKGSNLSPPHPQSTSTTK